MGFSFFKAVWWHFLLRAHPEFFFSALGCITGLFYRLLLKIMCKFVGFSRCLMS
jgi:hypothetical protein